MSKTWSSVHETAIKQTLKLESNKIYQITDVKTVKTEFGYHVILVEDARASKPLELKEIEPQLKNMVTQ